LKKTFNKMSKKVRILILLVVVVVIVSTLFVVFSKQKEENSAFDITPSYGEAFLGDISIDVYGDGNIESGYLKNISAQTTISLDNVLISEGAYAEQGQVIAHLDKDKMQENLDTLAEELNSFQQDIASSYKESNILYIKSPVDGRLKFAVAEEEDLVEDLMQEYGYLAVVVENRMKIVVGEEKYNELSNCGEQLVIRTAGYKYDDDITLEVVDGEYCVILPTAKRDEGQASVYLASATKEGNEVFTGNLKFINPVNIECTYGEVTLVDDDENNLVDKGEVLYHVEQYAYTLDNDIKQLNVLREEYEFCKELLNTLEFTAPESGIYTDLSLKDGQTIARDEMISVVKSVEDWIATVAIDELDISNIKVGQKASVIVDAFDGQEFEATVAEISSAGAASGGITTYDVVLQIESDEFFKVALTISAEIQVESVSDVVCVPATAIKTMGMRSYVIVASERPESEIAQIKKAILDNDNQTLMGYMGIEMQSNAQAGKSVDSEKAQEGERDSTQRQKAMQSRMMITNPTDLLFGQVVFVETGLQDTSNIEIISGLVGDEQILLSTISNSETDSEQTDKSANMAGMGMMGGTMGGTPPEGRTGGGR